MQKTRLGIEVGLMGTIIYFTGLFSGYLVAIILTGYVLLFEENPWLKRSAVKAIVTMTFFSGLSVICNLIPDILTFLNSCIYIFGASFSTVLVSKIMSVINSGIDITQKVLFLGLGLKALNQSTIVIPAIDRFVSKYMD